MSRIKSSQHATVAVGAALLSFALTACPNEQGPDDWGDFSSDVGADATDASDASDVADASDTRDMGEEPRNSSFLPRKAPEDTLCSDGWCWVHPRPFPYDVRELGVVDQQVYGLVDTRSFSEPIPMVWDDEIELGPTFGSVYEEGSVVDTAVGQNGWLALTADGTVFEFNTDTILDHYELPPDEYFSLQGESADLFIAGTTNGGGYIRRGGQLMEDPDLPSNLRGLRMWSNGDVWQVTHSAPQDPPQPDRRRWFELRESQEPPRPPQHWVTIGPDPTSTCAHLGIWTTLRPGGFYRWQEPHESQTQPTGWNQVESLPTPPISDFTCSGDGELFAAASIGSIFRLAEGAWSLVSSDVGFGAVHMVTLNDTLYTAGSKGRMYELKGSDVRRRGGRFLPVGVPGGGRFSAFWVSQDEQVAMFMEEDSIYRVDNDGAREVTPEGPVALGGDTRNNEIWGIEDPVFIRSHSTLFRWTGRIWAESPLTAKSAQSLELVALSGVAEDDVWLAADRELFHFDGDDWTKVSSDGSQVARAIENKDTDITHLAMASDSRGYVAMGAEVLELKKNADSWTLQRFKDSPCNRLSTLYVSDSDQLWAAGTPMCVSRSTESGWDVFEPTFNWNTDIPPGQQIPLTQWDFFDHPGSEYPMAATVHGLVQPTEDDRLEDAGSSHLVGATYLSDAEIMVAVSYSGILARYD